MMMYIFFSIHKRMDSPTRNTFLSASPRDTVKALLAPRSNKADFILSLNMVLAIIHACLAIGFGIYFAKIFGIFDKCNSAIVSSTELVPTDFYTHGFEGFSDKRFRMPEKLIASIAVGFFAITALFHFAYALNYSTFYTTEVASGGMRWRWLEYSITATMMIAIIAPLSGLRDLYAYVLCIVATIGVMSTGLWFEQGGGLIAVAVGFLLLIGVFVAIYSSYLDRERDAKDSGEEIPSWVKYAMIVTLAFFGCFGLVPIAQMVFGGPFIYYEIVYLFLSLAAKATLCGFVAYGFGERKNALS
jgi:hypothetical protein